MKGINMPQAKLVSLLAVILCLASGAFASATYTYTGHPFTQRDGFFGDRFTEIDISLIFDQSLGPSDGYFYMGGSNYGRLLDWQVSDGVITYGMSGFGALQTGMIVTNPTGQIVLWLFAAGETYSNGMFFQDLSYWGSDQALIGGTGTILDSIGRIDGSPGTWTGPGQTQTPEPGSFALVLGALAVGTAYRRRRARR